VVDADEKVIPTITLTLNPKCLDAEVSWCRSVRTPHKTNPKPA